ncbi:hypothetical protein J2T07_000152 [Luteibacter jiangsuensis]|uniref:DUF2946 family protein n=1 Tax=Luteibacter jiangsuensis TaxID=637577 RepID=A0ABT9SSL9_9GAMM|nr:hypothetical protein [Luteibacter jiangsuensis]MDQ0007993.1 hypothetical protein [Luteibacter jiangsuensis]
MRRTTPRLFTHLRRHRGVWMLALAVLLFKVAMSTFCVLDGPRVAFSGDAAGATAVSDTTLGDGDLCVLDEGKGCHCTCAHAVALPTSIASVIVPSLVSRVHPALPVMAPPAFTRSPLRPPIA